MSEPRLSINDRYEPPTDPEFLAKVVRCVLHHVERP